MTDLDSESSVRRRRAGWLVGVGVAVVAIVGWVVLSGSGDSGTPNAGPSATSISSSPITKAPGTTAKAAPSGQFPPWEITRAGNGLVVAGVLPDEQERSGLVTALTQVIPGALLKNELTVAPGVRSPDAAGFGSLFGALASIPDFSLVLRGDTMTLTGTARAEPIKANAEESAKAAFPDVEVVNDIEVTAASSAPAPARGPGQSCATLRADVGDALKTPITFDTDGVSLAPAGTTVVADVARKVVACPNAKVSVVGHTDDWGAAADNVALSDRRAKVVADALVSEGVAAGSVTSSGAGSSNPVATNATAEGRAQNRRVEITVNQPG